jgi:antitoxin VapB
MAEVGKAKLFRNGRSQAVRLPKEFRLPGTEVTVTRVGKGILLEPVERRLTWQEVFAELDRLQAEHGPFLPEGRPEQPPMPPPRAIFDE